MHLNTRKSRSNHPKRSSRSLRNSNQNATLKENHPSNRNVNQMMRKRYKHEGSDVFPNQKSGSSATPNNTKEYRRRSRSRYQKSMHGSGIANVLQFNSHRNIQEPKQVSLFSLGNGCAVSVSNGINF